MPKPTPQPLQPCRPGSCTSVTPHRFHATGEPAAWSELRNLTASVTHRWHSCSALLHMAGAARPPHAPSGLQFRREHGVWVPPDKAPGQHRSPSVRVRRLLTWEDSIPVNASRPFVFDRLFETPREGGTCKQGVCQCALRGCHYFPLPLSVGAVQRAARGFFAYPPGDGVAYFGLGIEKSGSSTLNDFFIRHQLHLNTTTPYDAVSLARCAHKSHLDLIREAEAAARGEAGVPWPVGCGQAATFDLGPSREGRQTFKFGFVREPVGRFISGLVPHGSVTRSAAESEPPLQRLAARARAMARWSAGSPLGSAGGAAGGAATAADAADAAAPPSYVDEMHTRTQSYFMASTDRSGLPIAWDAILRLEDMGSHGELLARTMLRHAARSDAAVSGALERGEPLWGRVNSKSSERAALERLRREVLSHGRLACDLCHIYGLDFGCFGYAFPDRCAELQCFASLAPPLQKALAVDCGERGWPNACDLPHVRA